MLCAVEHEHVSRDGLGRDQVRVLRHVARAVDLARMVDALHDADARLCRGERVAAELAALLVVRAAVEDVRAWSAARGDLYSRDLQVVGRLARRVRAEKQAVDRVWLVGRPGWEREISSRGGRVDGCTAHDSLSGNHWQVRLGQSSA